MHIAGRLYLRDNIFISDMMEVEKRILLIRGERKKSIVKRYLKEIVQLLTTVKFVTRFDLVHINKVLEKAGFVGSKEDLNKDKDSNIEKVLRWIGVRIGKTSHEVSSAMKLDRLQDYIKELTKKSIEETIQTINASLYEDKYKEMLEKRLESLENESTQKLDDTIVQKTKAPRMSTLMRNAFSAK